MLPIGYRIWAEDKMIYPVKFSMFVNNNKGTIFTRADRENVKSNIYMAITPFVAVNGYVFVEDIVTNGDVTGIVSQSNDDGAYVVTFNESNGMIYLKDLGKLKILGNKYENPDLISLCICPSERTESQPVIEDIAAADDEAVILDADVVMADSADFLDNEPILTEDELQAALEDEKSDEEIDLEAATEEKISSEENIEAENPDEEIKTSEEVEQNSSISAQNIDTQVYLAVYAKKAENKLAYAYIIKNGQNIIRSFNRFLDNADYIHGSILGIKDVLSHLSSEKNTDVYTNTKVVVTAFEKGMLEKWHNDGWAKEDGTVINFKDDWIDIYNLAKSKNIKWHISHYDDGNDDFAEQSNIAKNKYFDSI